MIFGSFGYTFKGVHKALLKSKQPTKLIRKARIMQGQRDLGEIEDGERRVVEERVVLGGRLCRRFGL